MYNVVQKSECASENTSIMHSYYISNAIRIRTFDVSGSSPSL